MKYQNPVVFQDFSDPDVIRRGDHFYMIASSFNHTPGVPVLKSVNLVDWKIIGYVFNDIPFERFNDVCHGDGAWAPALRYYKGTYYVVIPFPDEGIYVSSCTDIDKGNWTKPWCLVSGKGLIDPCPVWIKDKAYLAIGFAKSRIGFNSCLGLYEVSQDLKTNISGDYKIIYDGHHMNPTIEGPKFNLRNGYIYIMAPAGSVKSGWQVCLRSKDINGPYEAKIVLMQNDSPINGPHQGALIDLKDDKWAFIHFQDRGCYGRIIHLQPVKWVNDWPMCGNVKDELIAGLKNYKKIDFLHGLLAMKNCKFRKGRKPWKNAVAICGWVLPLNRKKLAQKLDKKCAALPYKDCKYVGYLTSTYRTREIMEKEIYGTPTPYQFEGITVYGPEKFDEYLTNLYHDWRKLPPEDKRVSVHDFIEIDLNKPYR